MVTALVNSTAYNILLLLHIAAVIAGFGGVVLNGLYAAKAGKAGGREGAAISVANFEVSKIAEYVIYTVPLWGIGLIFSSGKISGGKYLYGFDKPWISASLLLYAVAIGVAHAMLIPGHRKINARLVEAAEGRGGATVTEELKALNSRQAAAGASLNLVLVVTIYLMIFKPGQ